MSSSATDATCSIPQAVVSLVDLLRQAVDGEGLPHAARLKVVAAVRHAIIPKIVAKNKTRSKKRQRLDAAYADHKAGVRGLELFRKHIPNLAKLSRWRRRIEQNRLLKALQKRAERDKKHRQPMATIQAN